MPTAEKLDQVAEILESKHIPFQAGPDGELCLLRGSTAVYLDARPWGDGTLVHVRSPVVLGFPRECEVEAHMIANSLNRTTYFATFVVYEDIGGLTSRLEVEMDVLGEEMQPSELMNALGLVSGLADRYDDELAEQLRGRRFKDSS